MVDVNPAWLDSQNAPLRELQEHLPYLQSLGKVRFSGQLLMDNVGNGLDLDPSSDENAAWAIESEELLTELDSTLS